MRHRGKAESIGWPLMKSRRWLSNKGTLAIPAGMVKCRRLDRHWSNRNDRMVEIWDRPSTGDVMVVTVQRDSWAQPMHELRTGDWPAGDNAAALKTGIAA